MPKIRAVLPLLALLTACTSTISGHGAAASTSAPPSGSHSSSSTPATPTHPAANFTDCTSLLNLGSLNFPSGRKDKLAFGCATIAVPLDYSDPTGKKITIQLIKVHDTDDANPIGSLVVNPGGPGGSGVDLAVGLTAQIPETILQHFDLLGFDPRGVGLSTPISCISDSDKDVLNAAAPDVTTAAGFDQAKQVAREVAQSCNTKYGTSLADFNTVNTARDIDQIRQAVGDAKLNYLGFSYGTELGSIYAHLFPNNVRVAVLDGAVDPLTSDIQAFADQLKGFEGAFDQFAAWCRQHSGCSSLGDPRQKVYELVARAKASPIPSSRSGETRKATVANVLTGVLSALYSQSQWSSLGQALISGLNGDSMGLFSLADQYNERSPSGSYTNIADANDAINCNDSKPGPTDATIRQTAVQWAREFPMFGEWSASSLFGCQQWQGDRTPLPKPTAPTPTKVLVIGNLHDPATPYQGAIDLARTMGNAELLTWDGEGHTSYLQGSSCIDNYVDNYLVNAVLPPANTTCPR